MYTPKGSQYFKCAFALTVVVIVISLCVRYGVSMHGTVLTDDVLVGNWNATPYAASGMADNHSFFSDRRYRFGYNEMNLMDRRASLDGTWALLDDELVITIITKTELVGGTERWIGPESFIDGGEYVTSAIDPPMIVRYPVDEMACRETLPKDELFPYPNMGQGKPLFSIMIDEVEFWKVD